MCCQRHLLCVLVQLWLRFGYELNLGASLGMEVQYQAWGLRSSRMRQRMIREGTRTVAASQKNRVPSHGNDHTACQTASLFVPRACVVRSMDCAWIASGSVGTYASRWAGIVLYCTVLYVHTQ